MPDPGLQHASSRWPWAAPLLILSLILIAYSNSFTGPYIYDDHITIRDNPQIQSLFPPPNPTQTGVSGRPLLRITYWLDYRIAGLDVWIYHATNLLIHCIAALLLYGILRRTLTPDYPSAPWLAAAITALWAVHPLNTGAVTYLTQRAESLAALFYLATLYALIRSAQRTAFSRWSLLAILACAAGMATKEIVATAPLVAFLYDRTFLAGSFKSALQKRWPLYLGLGLTCIIVAVSAAGGARSESVGTSHGVSSLDYAHTQLTVIAHYLHLVFDPRGVCIDYHDLPVARHWSDIPPRGWFTAFLLLATLIALPLRPRLGFLGAWFFLILAPSSSFLPLVSEFVADYRMYLPLIAVIVLLILPACSLLPPRAVAALLAPILIVALACLVCFTYQRNDQFQSEVAIWQDAVQKYPGNGRALCNLGLAFLNRSDSEPDNSPQAVADASAAATAFDASLGIHDLDVTYLYLADALARAGMATQADAVYAQAIPRYPRIGFDLHVQRGAALLRRGDGNSAAQDFRAAISLNPGNPQAHYLLGIAYAQLQNWPGAQAEFTTTLQLFPAYLDAAQRLRDAAAHDHSH